MTNDRLAHHLQGKCRQISITDAIMRGEAKKPHSLPFDQASTLSDSENLIFNTACHKNHTQAIHQQRYSGLAKKPHNCFLVSKNKSHAHEKRDSCLVRSDMLTPCSFLEPCQADKALVLNARSIVRCRRSASAVGILSPGRWASSGKILRCTPCTRESSIALGSLRAFLGWRRS